MKSLFFVLVVAAVIGWLANPIANSVSSLGGGTQQIQYVQGQGTVVSASFDLPEEVAGAISQVSVSGWKTQLNGRTLTLNDGSLPPGQSLEIKYKIKKYITPGTTQLTGVFITSEGNKISSPGSLEISATAYLFLILETLNKYIIAISTAAILALVLWQRKRLFNRAGTLNKAKEATKEQPEKGDTYIDNGPNQVVDQVDKTPDDKKKQQKPDKLGIAISTCPFDFVPEGLNYVKFDAAVYRYEDGQWKYPGPPVQLTFRLHNVSKEKGVCMNFGTTEAPDLFFPAELNPTFTPLRSNGGDEARSCPKKILGKPNPRHKGHYLEAQTISPVTKATIIVRSEDFGGWGWIEAHATQDYLELAPLPPGASPPPSDPGTAYTPGDVERAYWVKVPYDTNENNIPDFCKVYDKGRPYEAGVRIDDDRHPENEQALGDGLTVYEEYRGFIVNEGDPVIESGKIKGYGEKHIRTNPEQKDIFVYANPAWLVEAIKESPFKETGLAVHFITDPEYVSKPINEKESPVINFNNGYARLKDGPREACQQHLIWVRRHTPHAYQTNEDLEGRACPKDMHASKMVPGTPKDITHVCIKEKVCDEGCKPKATAEQRDKLLTIIAHEMSHAVNIPHHGETRGGRDGKGITGKDGGTYFEEGGPTSGDPNCVLRYFWLADGWYEQDGSFHRTYTAVDKKKKKIRLETPGKTYCTSKKGYGVNQDGSATNDATAGNCRSYIKVRDW